jgi:Flp pilus assembly protein TadB
MYSMGGGTAVFLVVLVLVYGLLFVGMVALGTLVARRVWRWDARREQERQADVSPGDP